MKAISTVTPAVPKASARNIACGGFENDSEMIEHFPQIADSGYSGTSYNTGDGIRMAMEAGAGLRHISDVRVLIRVDHQVIVYTIVDVSGEERAADLEEDFEGQIMDKNKPGACGQDGGRRG